MHSAKSMRVSLALALAAFTMVFVITACVSVTHLWLPRFRSNGWWVTGDLVVIILWSAIAGAFSAAGVLHAVNRVEHWCGLHRCPHCDRAVRAGWAPCVCQPESEHDQYRRYRERNRARPFKHWRWIGKSVAVLTLLLYAAIVPLLLLVPSPNRPGLAQALPGCHALVGLLGAHVFEIAVSVLPLSRRKRWRVRWKAINVPYRSLLLFELLLYCVVVQ